MRILWRRRLRIRCICAGVRRPTLGRRGPRECGCWVGPALEVGVTVVACRWRIFAAGIEGRFWYGGEHRSKFEASSKTKLDGCMFWVQHCDLRTGDYGPRIVPFCGIFRAGIMLFLGICNHRGGSTQFCLHLEKVWPPGFVNNYHQPLWHWLATRLSFWNDSFFASLDRLFASQWVPVGTGQSTEWYRRGDWRPQMAVLIDSLPA